MQALLPLCRRSRCLLAVTQRFSQTSTKTSVEIAEEFANDQLWVKSSQHLKTLTHFINHSPSASRTYPQDMAQLIHEKLKSVPQPLKEEEAGKAASTRLISALLTFPVSTAHAINELCAASILPTSRLNITIVGARSESSLPAVWWKELLYLFNHNLFPATSSPPNSNNIRLHFLGPQLQQQFSSPEWRKVLSVPESAQLELLARERDRGFLHENEEVLQLLQQTDVFLLFHPGYGSSQLSESWRPTISLLLESRKPVICTAFSDDDLSDDLHQLRRIAEEEDHQELGDNVEMILPPRLNPFASLRRELRSNKVVQTNKYFYCFQGK